MKSRESVYIANPARSLLLSIAIAGLLFPSLTIGLSAGLEPGWVKLESGRAHNGYAVRSGIGTYGGFTASNVREGDNASDKQIPDGTYWVTFWVEGSTGRTGVEEVEHKKEMEFKGGKMTGYIRLEVALGKITSAGVSYPP